MAFTMDTLESYLNQIRELGERSIAECDEEFNETKAWCESALQEILSGGANLDVDKQQAPIVHVPKTPVAKHKRVPLELKGRQLVYERSNSEEVQEVQVTSSSDTLCFSTDPKCIKVEASTSPETSLEEIIFLNDSINNNTVRQKSGCLTGRVSKKNVPKEKIPTNSSTCIKVEPMSGERVAANRTYMNRAKSHKESIGANSTYVKDGTFHKESIGANSTYVKDGPFHKESIGANSTYVKNGPFPKDSIGANSTYVKDGPLYKESIGANSTYVKDGPFHKESVGANSTYVKDGPLHKESIGANSTYVKDGPLHKESIGANSTYVKDGQVHKESIGANSTYVLQKAVNSKQTDKGNSSKDASCSSLDHSILEASRIAVEEAMKGPVRLTRTKAKAVAQQAAQQAQQDMPIKNNASSSKEAKATLRQARKSLNRAKTVALLGKPAGCPKGKLWCNDSHSKTGATKCEKPVVKGRLRCVSQTESLPHNVINKHLGGAKIQRTLSHNDLKGTSSSVGKKITVKGAPVSSTGPYAAKTAAVSQKTVLKKKSDEKTKKLQEKAVQLTAIRAEREKVVVNIQLSINTKQQTNYVQSEMFPQKKVIKDDGSNKATFIKNVADQGRSYLAQPLHLRAQAQDASTSTKTHPPVLKSADLPINQTFEVGSYDISLDPGARAPLPSKSEYDYGLDDVCSDDSSDDEENPKKVIPQWAQAYTRDQELELQYEIQHPQMFTFFNSEKATVDLSKLFNDIDKRLLTRRSSAVWKSPERKRGN